LLGPRVTVAPVKKWLPVSQAPVSFVHAWALCSPPARTKK
jgi:hypothetical protein